MTIGKTIRRLREERGWSQGQVHIKTGIPETQISRIERDVHKDISAKNVARLAKAFGVTADYLLREAEWLDSHRPVNDPTPPEQQLIDTIRSVPSKNIRDSLLEQLTWIAEVTRDADLARQK